MLEEEAKAKFLKRVTPQRDVVEVLKEALPVRMKGGVNGYDILTKTKVTKAEPASVEGFLQFSKQIYDIWYERIMMVDESKIAYPATKAAVATIKASKQLRPENMTPQRCYDFIFKIYDQKFKNTGLRPMWSQMHSEPIVDGHVQPHFIHFNPMLSSRKTTCRLYINLKPENALQVAGLLAQRCKQQKVDLYSKIWTDGSDRNDTFLVYTNFRNAEKIVPILEQIHQEQPELFEGAENMNPFVAKVNSFIGYGDEPEYQHSSFNLERGEAIDEYCADLISNEFKRIANYKQKVHTSTGEDLTLREYLIYRTETEFMSIIDKEYNNVVHGIFPRGVGADAKRSYAEFYIKLRQICQKGLPKQIRNQIEKSADENIERMKQGKTPVDATIKVATRRVELFPEYCREAYTEMVQNGGVLEYDIQLEKKSLRTKLFRVFGSEEVMKRQITKEGAKPYFDKHHVSILSPHLNTESERMA